MFEYIIILILSLSVFLYAMNISMNHLSQEKKNSYFTANNQLNNISDIEILLHQSNGLPLSINTAVILKLRIKRSLEIILKKFPDREDCKQRILSINKFVSDAANITAKPSLPKIEDDLSINKMMSVLLKLKTVFDSEKRLQSSPSSKFTNELDRINFLIMFLNVKKSIKLADSEFNKNNRSQARIHYRKALDLIKSSKKNIETDWLNLTTDYCRSRLKLSDNEIAENNNPNVIASDTGLERMLDINKSKQRLRYRDFAM